MEHRDGFDLVLATGTAKIRRLAPGVVRLTYAGVVSGEVVEPLRDLLDAEIAACGQLWFFIDAAELESYHPEFRKLWTAWLKVNKPNLHALHLLIRSRIVWMGLKIVNPLVGNYLVGHANDKTFEAELQAALAAAAPAATG